MRVAVDTGVVIATLDGETDALLEYARRGWRLYITEYNLTEVLYVLCRRFGIETAEKIVESLLKSRVLTPYPTTELRKLAAACKCKYKIALPDCYTIALAQRLGSKALFRREGELEKAVNGDGELAKIIEFL